MEVQELIGALFNIALVVMIVATMVSAGYTTTFANLGSVLRNFGIAPALVDHFPDGRPTEGQEPTSPRRAGVMSSGRLSSASALPENRFSRN